MQMFLTYEPQIEILTKNEARLNAQGFKIVPISAKIPISYQLSAISYQLSAISYQLSAIS